MAAIPTVIWWALAAVGIGYGVKETGEGVNNASNGALKLALTGAAVYAGLKHFKVI